MVRWLMPDRVKPKMASRCILSATVSHERIRLGADRWTGVHFHWPERMLITPFGNPASTTSLAMWRADSGVFSEVFITMVQPLIARHSDGSVASDCAVKQPTHIPQSTR